MTTEDRYASLRRSFGYMMHDLYGEPYLSDKEWTGLMNDPKSREEIETAVAGVKAHQQIIKMVLGSRHLRAKAQLN